MKIVRNLIKPIKQHLPQNDEEVEEEYFMGFGSQPEIIPKQQSSRYPWETGFYGFSWNGKVETTSRILTLETD